MLLNVLQSEIKLSFSIYLPWNCVKKPLKVKLSCSLSHSNEGYSCRLISLWTVWVLGWSSPRWVWHFVLWHLHYLSPFCSARFHSCLSHKWDFCPDESSLSLLALYSPLATKPLFSLGLFLYMFPTLFPFLFHLSPVCNYLSLFQIEFNLEQIRGKSVRSGHALHTTDSSLGVFRVWSACQYWR